MEATSLRSANIEHLIEFIGFHFASRLESRRRWGRFSMRKGGASHANRNRSCDRRLVQFAFSKTKMLCAKWGFNYFKHLWKLRAESGREKRFHFCIKARKIMWSHYGLFCFFLHLEHSWNNCEHFCSSNNRKKFKSRSCSEMIIETNGDGAASKDFNERKGLRQTRFEMARNASELWLN